MNALHEINRAVYGEIEGTAADCFYKDELIDAFILAVSPNE